MGLAFYYAPLTLIWVCAIGCVIYSLRQLILRVHLVRDEMRLRNQSAAAATAAENRAVQLTRMKSREPPSSALQQTLDKTADFQRRASLQLSAYLVVFIFFSTFGLANRLASLANGGAPTPDWLVMAQAITMPLQGFANGIVFFRWVRENWSFPCLGGSIREIASLEEVSVADPAPTFDMLNVSGRDSPSIVAQPTAAGRQTQPRRHEFTARVFAATWNLGEAEPPDGVVPLLAEWLPEAVTSI